MREAGLPLEPGLVVETGVQAEGARAATRALFAAGPRPTALLAAGNQMVEGALLGLADLGLRHGREVTVVGYDIPYAAVFDPPVPIVVSPNAELGRRAVEVVIGLIEGRLPRVPRLRLPVRFAPDGVLRPPRP
jgi:DNA-binding LacI/PurR family transcriptional regulator